MYEFIKFGSNTFGYYRFKYMEIIYGGTEVIGYVPDFKLNVI